MADIEFLREFVIEGGLLSILIGQWTKADYFAETPSDLPSDRDVYFGVAARKKKGNEKGDILGTRALWVDADDIQRPQSTLPPSAVVMSGHGYHLYWFLEEPLMESASIEFMNQLLAKDVPTGDPACWNANRILRVPGTINTKNPEEPISVTRLKWSPELKYRPDDFKVLEKLAKATRHKIRTGDARGYRSRSERDWAVITDLIACGASDDLIHIIFAHQPIGDKAKLDAQPQYLEHTIEKARASKAVAAKRVETGASPIEEREDGYYISSRRGTRRVSTFTFHPKILLDGSGYHAEDAIVGDVVTQGYSWENVTLTRSAFTSVPKMDRETPVAAWQWLGSDSDVRQLLPYILTQLQEGGLPRVIASPYIGLHFKKGIPYFIGTDGVLSAEQFWPDFTGPLAWLPSQREHPATKLAPEVTEDDLTRLREILPLVNEPQVVWLMLGWYAAAVVKPWLEEQGYRFPVLSVVGTKGSGKTTLIQRVFAPLFGQLNSKSYDAGTTRFVILAILGSSNAVPVAFSEFRYESAERFLRYVLLSYDTGHDPRGRGDQTTVDYPLLAPFSIDGEDLIADPAARERIVCAHLHPGVIGEGSEAYEAYSQIRNNIPVGFGGFYIQQVLSRLADGRLLDTLKAARASVFKEFPDKLPDRVRNNHTVALFGAYAWADIVGMERPDASFLQRSVQTVFSLVAGRSRTLADDLVEDIINACSVHTSSFHWEVDGQHTLFFQFGPAHSWWLASRRRQGRTGLERDALKAQLFEAPYVLPARAVSGTWMVGIDLEKAQLAGLDVPSELHVKELRVRF